MGSVHSFSSFGSLKLALSDHYLVYAIRKFRGNIPCNHKMIKTRQMKNFNEELFLKDLVNVDWQQILTCSQDINVVVQNWTNMLSLIIEKHAPLRERRVSDKFAPWLTPDLMNVFRTRDRLKAAAIKSKSVLLLEAYKKFRNKANALNTRLKKSYFTDKIHSCEGNIKETWTTINKLINKRSKTTNITSLRVDDETITKPDLIAESMNKYFCSVGEQLSKKIPKKMNSFISSQILAPESNFSFSPVNAEDLTKAMSKFKSSQGFGMDNISSFFLKKRMPIFGNGLCQIFNMSLSTGKFPDSWKAARVAPIYKDGSSSENSNYRPISVLPVVSRLFEKLMYDQLYTYLSNNHLLFTGQSGFRRFHSVLTSLLKCSNDWYLNLDKGHYTSVTFIDHKKAFDTVDHQILLQKLRVYGLAGKEISWFQSYLDNRKQCCKVNGHMSKQENIHFGVPQGSCLGPLLFLIYINDLPLALDSSNVNMYADDTSIYYSSKSISSINNAVNNDLQPLKSWLEENKLSLNVAKTQSILIGSRYKIRAVEQPDNQKPSLHIGDEAISIITSTKYLGVQVDQFLNWDEHLVTITKKVSRSLGMLRYAKRYLPLVTVQAMYKSLIEPHFRY